MTRVLLDFRVRTGGVGRYGRDLIAGLRALGTAPDVAVLGPGSTRLERLTRAAFTPWGRRCVLRTSTRIGANLIHGLHLEAPSTAIPTVVTIQDLIPIEHPSSMPNTLKRLTYLQLLHAAIRRCARVIVPGSATASALLRIGCPSDKIVLIPIGIGPGFHPCGSEEIAEARGRFADGRPYVAATPTEKAHKNLRGLGAVAALLEGIGLPVVCTGRPSRSGTYPKLRFAGRLSEEDLRLFYGGAECFVLPSYLEGFGLPAVEALACGTPVVCGSGVGALPHIHPGVLLVDVSRPSEIAGAARRIAQDKSLRSELSEAGQLAVAGLTRDKMARETAAVYAFVAASGSALPSLRDV